MTKSSQIALRMIALYLIKKLLPAGASRFDVTAADHPHRALFTSLMADASQDPALWTDAIAGALTATLAEITPYVPDFTDPALTQNERIQKLTTNADLRSFVQEMTKLKDPEMRDLLRDLQPPVAPAGGDASAAAAPPADDTATPSYTPLAIPKIDRSLLSTADRIVAQATNGSVRSVFQIIESLDNAQKILAKGGMHARKAVTPIPADGPLPSGTMRMLPAASVFATKIPPEHAHRFTFDIPVYTWDAPHPYVPIANPNYAFDPVSLRQALWGIAKGLNAVLVGPTGCGKTTMAEALAAHLGRPFFRIPVHGEMRKRDMIGGFKQVTTERGSETQWFDGLLTKAISMPSIIDMDEIDRADPDLQYVAHQAYERKGITILDDGGRFIAPHPDHAILATANTKGRDDGENPYGLRQEMSEATRDRFPLWIDCKYMPEDQELATILADCPGLPRDSAQRCISYANLMRSAFVSNRLSTTCSYRQLTAVANWIEGLNPRDPLERKAAEVEAIHTILINRVPLASDVSAAEEFGRQIYGDDWK
jgi:MoxR-like ATPase